MEPIVNLQSGEIFPLNDGMPADYRGIILKNSVSSFHQSGSALIILQNFTNPEYSIHLGIYKFLGLVKAALQPQYFQTGSLLNVRTDLKSSIKGVGSLHLKKNQFVFLHKGKESIHAQFIKEKEYQLLGVSWNDKMVDDTLYQLSQHNKLTIPFQKMLNEKKTAPILTPKNSNEKILDVVNDILESPFEPNMNEVYIGYKIREYLLLLLMQSSNKEESRLQITEAEKLAIHNLAEQLEADPKGKYPIGTLAKKLGMNEIKLKLAFKQIFGKGIFSFHEFHRMNEAKRLLKETDLPIKQIAALVGYELTTSFITHFREHFGYPPSKVQKKPGGTETEI